MHRPASNSRWIWSQVDQGMLTGGKSPMTSSRTRSVNKPSTRFSIRTVTTSSKNSTNSPSTSYRSGDVRTSLVVSRRISSWSGTNTPTKMWVTVNSWWVRLEVTNNPEKFVQEPLVFSLLKCQMSNVHISCICLSISCFIHTVQDLRLFQQWIVTKVGIKRKSYYKMVEEYDGENPNGPCELFGPDGPTPR